MPCTMDGKANTCRVHVQNLKQWTYQPTGAADPCGMAYDEVRRKCATCEHCDRLDSCPPPTSTRTVTSTVTELWDCTAGLAGAAAWPLAKQRYCCDHHGQGCPHTTRPPYVCEASDAKDWGYFKKEWCCKNAKLGCDATLDTSTTIVVAADAGRTYAAGGAATTVAPFDCAGAGSGAEQGWAQERQAWCCRNRGTACPTAAPGGTGGEPAEPWNCVAGYSSWRTSWNQAKKDWCCANFEMGCPEEGGGADAATASFDCLDGFADWQEEWSKKKKAWCCRHRSLGCDAAMPAVVPVFDDLAAVAATEGASAAAVHAAADSAATAPTDARYDCVDKLLFWKQSWSYERKEWCCKHKKLGCYDCSGKPTTWASDQLEWCCRSKDVGCHLYHTASAVVSAYSAGPLRGRGSGGAGGPATSGERRAAAAAGGGAPSVGAEAPGAPRAAASRLAAAAAATAAAAAAAALLLGLPRRGLRALLAGRPSLAAAGRPGALAYRAGAAVPLCSREEEEVRGACGWGAAVSAAGAAEGGAGASRQYILVHDADVSALQEPLFGAGAGHEGPGGQGLD